MNYEKVKEIVYALLLKECPEHGSQHHILYSANVSLAHIDAAKSHLRALIDPATPIGTYDKLKQQTINITSCTSHPRIYEPMR